MAEGDNGTQHKLGEHEATIQSLHYRLDDLKHMLERFQDEHRDEQQRTRDELIRVETTLNERLRPLERFKTGCYWVGSTITAAGSALAAWLKGGGTGI